MAVVAAVVVRIAPVKVDEAGAFDARVGRIVVGVVEEVVDNFDFAPVVGIDCVQEADIVGVGVVVALVEGVVVAAWREVGQEALFVGVQFASTLAPRRDPVQR